MSALAAVITRDWRDSARTGALRWLLIGFAALAMAALASGAVRVAETERDRLAAEAADARTFNEQGARNPHAVAHFARYAMRPMGGMTLLDPGIVPFAGTAIWMEAHTQNPANARPAEDDGVNPRFGALTPAWIALTLLPLLAIAFGHGAIARERQGGTWPLLLLGGATPATLTRAKAAGVAVPVLGPALLFGALSVAVAFVAGGGLFPDDELRAAGWVLGVGVYAAIALFVSLGVSAVASSARQALLVLLSAWLIAVFAVPRLGSTVADQMIPAPHGQAFAATLKQEVRDAVQAARAGHGSGPNSPKTVTAPDGRVLSFQGLRLQQGEEIGDVIHDRRYAELYGQYRAQERVRAWFGLLSPAVPFQALSATLAGTDIAHQQDFQAQAETTRRAMVKVLNTDMIDKAGDQGSDYLSDPALWRTIPSFTYRAPALADLPTRALWDALALLIWLATAIGFYGWAMARLSRPQ
jgi:ABC-2 type transport system permease protein